MNTNLCKIKLFTKHQIYANLLADGVDELGALQMYNEL